MVFRTEKFQSKTNEWGTPDEIFLPLNKEFGFNLDKSKFSKIPIICSNVEPPAGRGIVQILYLLR